MRRSWTTVLVVEDDAEFRGLVVDALGEEPDLVVFAVEDGRDALLAVETIRPQVILLDLRMPRMDGAEFLRALRSDPEQADVPVVAMTARGVVELAREVEEMGIRVLRKPFGIPELVAAIRQALDQSS